MKTILRAALTGTCFASVALLGACQKPVPRAEENYAMGEATLPPLPASIPLESGPETPLIAAPSVERLPPAPRLPLRRLARDYDDYAYLERASLYDDVFFDAPPDYAFDYDGVSPWGWEGYDGAIAYAEPLDDGYRYYYYEPGYDTPYLVRDPYYSYAFDGPSLVVIYDQAGRVLRREDYGPRWDYASRYFTRGRDLRIAGKRDRRGVIAANWAAQGPQIAAASAALDAARSRDAAWRAYHDRSRVREGSHWRTERVARAEAVRQFDALRRSGYQQRRSDFADFERSGEHRPRYMLAPNGRAGGRTDSGPPDRRFDDRQRGDERRVQREELRSQRQQAMQVQREQQRAQRQQAMQAQRDQQRAQRQQAMQAQREQQRTQRQQAMQAQREQQRAQRQQAMQAQRDQQRAQRQQAMQAQREQQRAQRQQAMQAQREQQRAQRQQAMQVQREQQRAQRQQAMQVQREQQRAQRQQAMQAQHEQQRAQRQQAMQAQREQQRAQRQQAMQAPQPGHQARNEAPRQPGGGHGRGRD